MKELLLVFIFTSLCCSLSGQKGPSPVDTSLNLSLPYKLELQKVGGMPWKAISIYNAKYTPLQGDTVRRCRVSISSITGAFSSIASTSIHEDIADLTADQATYLREDLSRLFVIAKQGNPKAIVSYRNEVKGKLTYTLEGNPAWGYNLWMSIDAFPRKWEKIPINVVGKFAKVLDACIEFAKP
jgi:hypothetical protein